MMCAYLNSDETVESMMERLNNFAMNHDECATTRVNTALLYKVIDGYLGQYFDADERPLFYKDSAIMFYGKDGILITNKAIYRLRKDGVAKIYISNIHTLNLWDVIRRKIVVGGILIIIESLI